MWTQLPRTKALLPILALATLSVGCQRASAQSAPPAQLTSAPIPAPGATLDTASLVEKVKSSVVNITVESTKKLASADDQMSPFEFFFRNGPNLQPQLPRKQHALGTG